MTDLSADLVQQKQKLREKLRFRRKHFADNLDGMAQLAAFRALPAPLSELLANHAVVGAYVAWGDEPDILPMFAGLADAGALALPHHAARVDTMGFRRWRPGESLVKGPWGTQQPADDSPLANPNLIFCPLVGFDRQGGRIGQGGGHYDCYFAAHPDALRIGIGWSVQEIDATPRESTDIALDAILTEQEFIVCGDRL
ncbi:MULTISPECIES: 5-formyltetrahydrofolate cyclo-ligase [unclassified Sphingopyxis]|uniref:5-formyltetrahydrofolate cyclo-ligase n=1 Tax=unclassified Sphingopyxis TaxID=2614943 RepID=UPI0028555C18|nr:MULTISPECIES: 5-formyltetrahydrofolate cyclo-ligase [unclassified Sphingopyxis]MDR7059780.1 5-formyltetrahydrofolate cyclo-ligase [Sphingopyxis sp. BE235]MDR7180708.1 5-formyltetrahydrofolate cyclo-ligase [Sphingopyxis sp. BE249]